MAGDHAPYRVLILDSEQQTRVQTRQVLELAGFSVSEANDCAQALDIWHRNVADVIMINAVSSRLDALSACRLFRKQPAGWNNPILFLTRQNDADAVKRAYEAGATGIIAKPCHRNVLSYRVRCVLHAHQAVEACVKSGNGAADSPPRTQGAGNERTVKSMLTYPSQNKRQAVKPSRNEVPGPVTGSRPGMEKGSERLGDTPHPTQLGEKLTSKKQTGKLAYYDSLTGFPNQVLYKELLTSTLASAGQNQKVATMFLDMDLYGGNLHKNGEDLSDELLKSFARRLRHCMRRLNRCRPDMPPFTTGCLGGGKFSIIMSETSGKENAANVAVRIIREFSSPFQLKRRKVSVAINIGISIYPDDGSDIFTLLRKSEIAMFRAKDSGRNTYDLYETTASTSAIGYSSLMIT